MKQSNHKSICPEELINCAQCKLKVIRKLLKCHIKSCPDQIVKCQDCGLKMKRNKFLQHQKVCLGKQIKCKSCSCDIKRKDYTIHDCITELKKLNKVIRGGNWKCEKCETINSVIYSQIESIMCRNCNMVNKTIEFMISDFQS